MGIPEIHTNSYTRVAGINFNAANQLKLSDVIKICFIACTNILMFGTQSFC